MFLKNNDSKSLEILDRLWGRDLVPWHLERHFFLYWFTVHQGDLDQIARALQVHRNSVQFHFDRFGLSEKSEMLRQNWRVLLAGSQPRSFEAKFFKLYRLHEIKNELSAGENKSLIRLWKLGFSSQTLSAHYMLWALRQGWSKEWIEKKLGFSSHHCMRILVTVLDPQSENGRRLAPLKPRPEEIYTRGPKNRLRKPAAAEKQMAVSQSI